MHNEAQIILQQVFNKRALKDVSLNELKALTEQYPYFNAAQFLLAKKIRQEKAEANSVSQPGFSNQTESNSNISSAKHPALFFHNPLWFNFLMKQELESSEMTVEDELVLDSKLLAEQTGYQRDAAKTEDPEPEEQNNGSTVFLESEKNGTEDQVVVENGIEEHSAPGLSDNEESLSNDNALEPIESDIQGTEDQEYENQGAQNPPLHSMTEVQGENDSDAVDNVEEQSVPDPGENQKLAESVRQSAIRQHEPTDESLEFEPFHTIDYFASQGIKLQQADLSKDKFGQQLRSFTDWLKSMKKIPAPSADDAGDPVVQEQVIQFAQVSNETKEIITETMAEVWSLQGNRQKAIEIYKKLSLLNPAKSAYFASKIDKLNS